jgi:hypothetical protein
MTKCGLKENLKEGSESRNRCNTHNVEGSTKTLRGMRTLPFARYQKRLLSTAENSLFDDSPAFVVLERQKWPGLYQVIPEWAVD